MRQIFGEIGWEKKLLAFFVPLVILIVLGPFGTYEDLDIWGRSVFWVIVVGGVGFCMHITMSVALASPYLGKLAQIPRLALGACAGGFPGAAIVVFVNAVMRPPMMSTENMPIIWLQVTLIGLLIGLFEYIDWRRAKPEELPAAARPDTKLHARLKAGSAADIISMSMHDHYVSVMTSEGAEMLLLRFSDAIEDTAPIDGIRIHRSHWIAAEHLTRVERQGARALAHLSDGRSLPISKSNISEAKAALAERQP